MTPSLTSRTTVRARFPINLHLPEAPREFVENAAEAVRKEYRSSVQWKQLRCRKVQPLTGDPSETIFVLDVGHSIEFDWTWEGAVAFRPKDPTAFSGRADGTEHFTDPLSDDAVANSKIGVWAGEVVEVDETNGRLFVSVSSCDCPPCRGTFFVRPFEFLAFLHAILCQPGDVELTGFLPARLHAARGGVHPRLTTPPDSGLTELRQLWRHSWGILWGPPGCGKTTTLGRQVVACLNDPAERILVLSTTNKATDEAALAIGRSALAVSSSPLDEGRVLRIGKGADYGAYEANRLAGLLRGTETDLLQQIGLLTRDLHRARPHEEKAVLRKQIQGLRRSMKDSAFNVFVSPDVQVVVATAFKAVTLLGDPDVREMVAAGKSPFTTVAIDEAGLMSRAVVAALSLLAARRVVVVGDGMQLAPISKISRILPTSQAVWLANNCLGHLQSVLQADHEPGVHLLREQHRMHPDISRVVSHFQYEGALRDAASVLSRQTSLPHLLVEGARAAWYVLDEDCDDLPSIRAERGPGNRSWVRPGTRRVLAKLFSDPQVRQVRGLFITPFKAQASDIAAYLAEQGLDSWSSGTVHGRQGTEAEVVVFDTVNAGSCGWPYDEWKRLINVGLSRAREFVLLLASRAEMTEPYLSPLLDTLAPRILKRSGRGVFWAEVPARVAGVIPPDIPSDPALLGNQIARRKALRPVMSAEQQRLCGLSMDGKPRLVRGVAGSGKTLKALTKSLVGMRFAPLRGRPLLGGVTCHGFRTHARRLL